MAGNRWYPFRFVEFDNGCQTVLTRGNVNKDGYIRIWSVYHRRIVMLHRFIWEVRNGEIPEGYDIDHTCRCRQCCNPNHLRLLDGSQHAAESNRNRAILSRQSETRNT